MSLWIESVAAQVATAHVNGQRCFVVFLAVRERELVKGGDGVAFYQILPHPPPRTLVKGVVRFAFYQILPQHPPGPVYLESPSFRGLVFYEGLF